MREFVVRRANVHNEESPNYGKWVVAADGHDEYINKNNAIVGPSANADNFYDTQEEAELALIAAKIRGDAL